MSRNILFLTGTRADFGKLKSLISEISNHSDFNVNIFVTGMHMLSRYGMTVNEVLKAGFSNIYKFINQNCNDSMDCILAKTIIGLSDYVKEMKPDMIIVHGDRVEAMAGAIVGSLNNILVAHIEGGEVSGTIDELIRHSVSKMAHLHFVCNSEAKQRLIQLGEKESSVYVIGSPDLDIMMSNNLPSMDFAKEKYDIYFDKYSIFIYHPVTTELDHLNNNINNTIDALIESGDNYIVIYPNNDHGTDIILNNFDRLSSNNKFKIFPSINFECFLTLMKNSEFIIGNSSAGIREAPYYGIPTVNIGSRQKNRSNATSIINCDDDKKSILNAIKIAKNSRFEVSNNFGTGKSHALFAEILCFESTWNTEKQKAFIDIAHT